MQEAALVLACLYASRLSATIHQPRLRHTIDHTNQSEPGSTPYSFRVREASVSGSGHRVDDRSAANDLLGSVAAVSMDAGQRSGRAGQMTAAIRTIPVLHPFGDVAIHIIQPPPIRQLQPDRMCIRLSLVDRVPANPTEVFDLLFGFPKGPPAL